MEWLMPSRLLTLRQVNEKLRNALQRFRPELHQCSSILPGELSSVRGELLRVRECHREGNGSSPDPETAAALAREMREYRTNLERLEHILPDVQMRLLAERTRLRNAQVHIDAADAWAGANKETLQK
jgi:hypothetical protein